MHEVRQYLRLLLDHECSGGSCRDCEALRRIGQMLQDGLFTTRVFSDVPIAKPRRKRSYDRPIMAPAMPLELDALRR
jgi:plasmid rolling circle replication initiator protein Rep